MRRSIHPALAALVLAAPSVTIAAEEPASAVVETSLATGSRQIRQFAFDGDPETYFGSAAQPGKDDHFTLKLDRALPLDSVVITTGKPDGSDRLDRGALEVSADGKAFEEVARFAEGSARAEAGGRRVTAVRIRPDADLGHPIAIREIALASAEPVPTFRFPVEYAVDVTDSPDMKPWAEDVARLCERWYPRICEAFRTEGDKPPTYVTMLITSSYKGVAMAGGNRITGSTKFFKDHPDDLGAMIHETVHIVQRYRSRSNPGWLVEGVADYYRFFIYEPGKAGRVNPARAHYNDSYRTTAAFLDYVSRKYDKDLVFKLNGLMRKGQYKESAFQELTGKSVQDLGTEWLDSLRK